MKIALARAIPFVLLLLVAFCVFAETVDDPYITFRYAANLLNGHGPVFNVGERVEGFSSPLHLLISAVLLKTVPAIDIMFKAKLISLLCAVIALHQTYSPARITGLTHREALLAQMLIALNVNYAIASVNGLETTLYTCLVLASAGAFLTECRTGQGYRSATILFVALLARPETILLFVAMLFVRIQFVRQHHLASATIFRWACAFVVPMLVLEILRLWYFGIPLPNTYYAKSTTLSYSLRSGSLYLFRTLSPLQLDWRLLLNGQAPATESLQVVLTPVFWGFMLLGIQQMQRRVETAFLVSMIAMTSIFVLRSGGDWMHGWRFMVAVLPYIAILQVYGIRAVVIWFRRRANPIRSLQHCHRWIVAAIGALWVVSIIAAPRLSWALARFSTDGGDLLRVNAPGLQWGIRWVTVGHFIRDSLPRGTRVAYTEMGYAAYINLDKQFIDMKGLTNRKIADTPAIYKSEGGVMVQGWCRPEHPLYSILTECHPDIIISIPLEPEPDRVLRHYKVVNVLKHAGIPLARVYTLSR